MEAQINISAVAHIIQLSVAPVFLLLAIGSMLTVLTNRLGRVIDRAHVLERLPAAEATPQEFDKQLMVLMRRAQLANAGIALFTIAALLVCIVIAVLFLGALFDFNPSTPVATLFVLAMFSFIAGLAYFIAEIRVATANLRIGRRRE